MQNTANSETHSKNVLVSGASGLIGTAISHALQDAGYTVFALSRQDSGQPYYLDAARQRIHFDPNIPLQAVINLAGASIGDARWTQKRKQLIWDSRIQTTKLLSQAILASPQQPEVFISASAIGYYGNQCKEPADENSAAGTDFLAQLSIAWEAASDSVKQAGIRVVNPRFGLVLAPHGGVLEKLVLLGQFAVVGKLGDGSHLQSWISLSDTVNCLLCTINNTDFHGPLNIVAPEVVSNEYFANSLAKAVGAFALPAMPAAIVRIMFGGMADAALLASGNIVSTRQEELGFVPQQQTLPETLQQLYRGSASSAE